MKMVSSYWLTLFTTTAAAAFCLSSAPTADAAATFVASGRRRFSSPSSSEAMARRTMTRPTTTTEDNENHKNKNDGILFAATPAARRRTGIVSLAARNTKPSSSLASSTTETEEETTTQQKQPNDDEDDNIDIDEDAPAGIEGAQFFGGNKEKEQFYDPKAEANADVLLLGEDDESTTSYYTRFTNRNAFSTDQAAQLAQDVQTLIQKAVVVGKDGATTEATTTTTTTTKYRYADRVQWTTEFPNNNSDDAAATTTTQTPLLALQAAASEFYNSLNVAIVSAHPVVSSSSSQNDKDTQYELRWELAVAWPIFWEPKVIITGTSAVMVDSNNCITEQIDKLDAPLMSTIQQQIFPRFWDVYHIGMTPAAEVAPVVSTTKTRNLLFQEMYDIVELPPRWYMQPTLLDTGTRDDQNAAILPNHAFTCIIKTMGPTKQQYTTSTGVQVQINTPSSSSSAEEEDDETQQQQQSGLLQLEWHIPLAVDYAAQSEWKVPRNDDEGSEGDSSAGCEYVYEDRRYLAKVPYGGGPQDVEISKIRQRLYEQVVQKETSYVPKLDVNGRPKFVFGFDNLKCCYTSDGLGMAVYEWRPNFSQPGYVGLELERKNVN